MTTQQIQKEAAEYWAFKAPEKSEVSDTSNPLWNKSELDRLVFKKFSSKGLTPSREADKRVLIKRAYFDLHGLMPSYEEIEAFVADKEVNAYSQLIDRLLASPRYGERWGRHWLDVARYADTMGYNFTNSSQYPFAYTYRDYVIRSFNEDKPYDRFVMEQLAADRLNLQGEEQKNLAALGFLTISERYLNKIDEIVNDRIDVTTQAFLGLTVACARCHDHKVDPIPAADYYSLYGIFKSQHEPELDALPVIGEPSNKLAHQEFLTKNAEAEKAIDQKLDEIFEKVRKEWPEYADGYLDFVAESKFNNKKGEERDYRARALRSGLVKLTKSLVQDKAALENSFWSGLHRVYHASNDDAVKGILDSVLSAPTTPPSLKQAIEKFQPQTRQVYFQVCRDLVKATFEKQEEFKDIKELVFGDYFEKSFNQLERRSVVERAEREALIKLENDKKNLLMSEGAPSRAMVLYDNDKPFNPYVFIRGKSHDRGPEVKRRFVQVISTTKEHEDFGKGSGRLELAQSIADPKNPLTARVMANRLWQWHFGKGIVSTPSNFGKMGQVPTDIQLLDHLALKFIESGWSIKTMHRYIMNSAVYKQDSKLRADMMEKDGANDFAWRMNPRRMEWEPLHDILLQTAGMLQYSTGGPAVKLMSGETKPSRAIYGFLDRQSLADALKDFDFPSPQVTCEARTSTVVPQQGLFMLNSEFVLDLAHKLAATTKAENDAGKVIALFKRVFGREPTAVEREKALVYVRDNARHFDYKEPEWEYGVAPLLSNNELGEFKNFDVYKNNQWQFGNKFPNPELGYAMINSKGGHPGNDFAVIRRLRVFDEGSVSLSGSLIHKNSAGNGVRAVMMHNGRMVGEWRSHNASLSTESLSIELKPKDTIELVVDPIEKNPDNDSFEWPVVLAFKARGAREETIDSVQKFSGSAKPLKVEFDVWDSLAQILLMSNEFMYVD